MRLAQIQSDIDHNSALVPKAVITGFQKIFKGQQKTVLSHILYWDIVIFKRGVGEGNKQPLLRDG